MTIEEQARKLIEPYEMSGYELGGNIIMSKDALTLLFDKIKRITELENRMEEMRDHNILLLADKMRLENQMEEIRGEIEERIVICERLQEDGQFSEYMHREFEAREILSLFPKERSKG